MPNNHPFLKKRKSPIDNMGIFTERPINKGEVFYIVPVDTVVNVPTPRFAHIGKGLYVDDNAVLNWINHSCDPNTVLDISMVQPHLKSVRDIMLGEEITCDYNQTEKGGVRVLCNCKSPNCKGYFLRIE